MPILEVTIPDIGDLSDVAVIEVLVQPGDAVRAEQSLVTLESDKASMEVPSPSAGTVKALKIAVGDRVSQGSPVLTLETDAGAAAETARAAGPPTNPAPAAPASSAAPKGTPSGSPPPAAGPAGLECDLLVLGAGPGGYSAAFRAADLGLDTVLVERYPTLGGVCLNVGCIPSKALLHVASVVDEAARFGDFGIEFGAPTIDLAKLAAHKNKVVGKLTGGLVAMAKMRKVRVLRGSGRFLDAGRVAVDETEGEGRRPSGASRTIAFRRCIVAVGSEAVRLPFLPDDPRIVDSTGALALDSRPKRMLIVGGGIIGLEMGTVYSTLGARLDVVEMAGGLMPGADRDLVKVWQKINAPRFDRVMLKTRTVSGEATAEGIRVGFEGEAAPNEPQVYDLVLQAVGRTPNGRRIAAEAAGLAVNERGFIPVDVQMRSNVPAIFAIGDVVGQPMLAHKAVHEGHVAAEVAAGELKGDEALARSRFDARVIPAVAYTDPEVAWVGLTEGDAKAQGTKVEKALFPWSASGRAIANGCEEGFTKLLFDAAMHAIVGGGIVGPNAGDMIGEVALAIEMGADAVDIGRTIHPHPTLGETIGLAAEAAHGSCTDLPPARRV